MVRFSTSCETVIQKISTFKIPNKIKCGTCIIDICQSGSRFLVNGKPTDVYVVVDLLDDLDIYFENKC